MRVYFVDGCVSKKDGIPNIPQHSYYIVDAVQGYSACVSKINFLNSSIPNCSILTNFVEALDSDVCYNKETCTFDTYLISSSDGKWHNIQEFTSRELRYGHNIASLYKNGEFRRYVPCFTSTSIN